MPNYRVTMRRYPDGHVFAEIGKTGRCVGTVAPCAGGHYWSSLDIGPTVTDKGWREAEARMASMLRAEGFDVPEGGDDA
jgi:hypothetical protein